MGTMRQRVRPRLPPAIFGPNVLSKRVKTGPIITHFDPACTQTMPRSPEFNHRPMAGKTIMNKLWQANIIKMI